MEDNNQTNEKNDIEKVQAYQEVETKKKEVRTDSYFYGGVLELIGWRILATIISVVTLGLANPWAQCMLYSWQFKHTVYNGKNLKFEGTGGDLFVNIFKWIFFSIITLGIYIFFIPVKKAKWVISNIHYEDEDFKKDESFFDGKTLQFIGINILFKIMVACSFGLLYPFAVCLRLKWINKHTVINRKKLVFDGNGFQLWGKCLLWSIFTIITFGIFSIWLPISMLKWQSKHIHIKKVDEEEKKDYSLFIIIPIVIVLTTVMTLLLIKIIPNISEIDWKTVSTDIIDKTGLKDNAIKNKIDEKNNLLMDEESSPSASIESEQELQPLQEPIPAKTFITVGGYTLKLGTYKGKIEQGVWDETTMTATSRFIDVVLKLSDKNITINGEVGNYNISGNSIIWKGNKYLLDVTGNNKIRYNVENCPELVFQGY